ncbi:hypothetical protein SNOG_07336 [Parastagonospora nodorum SN15]|uniref:Uncharacterized protein n=1 Tax=Phaeosphaeria nodorum (strain SN15 / ATCC MYA-4574 / FGSC 10173) TaxID=321614 RepID=Q0ULM8_PHANO|nr:hypothetical protein SNOG_07336 [Parastagonospora nodorum SN15]EAT84802.2 hypothetical protein SNOG_07336 [Parastagonospora nodorum SN15]
MSTSAPGPNASIANKIKWLYQGTERPSTYPTEADNLEKEVKNLTVKDEQPSIEEQIKLKMPVHPAEENATGTKESSDSNASTHELHDSKEANEATSGGAAHANAHKANPGPVHADNLPTPESKADLKKRAEELNK